MQNVITAEQARKITGGRRPHVPLEYEQACRALEACITLDEAKYWSDKSDALAAWAKIYGDDRIERQAKALKLRAYRRMGELATELRPFKRRGHGIGPEGPQTALRELGMSTAHAKSAVYLARVPADAVKELEQRKRIPTPGHAEHILRGETNDFSRLAAALFSLSPLTERVGPGPFKKWVVTSSRGTWKKHAEQVYEWLELLLEP